MRPLFAILSLLPLAIWGCGSSAPPPAAPPAVAAAQAPVHPWILSCVDANDPEPALLWNGLIGVRLARDGTGIGPDGNPLGFFAIDEYESTGEEKIRTLPNPMAASFKAGGDTIDPQNGAGYQQNLDMGNGILMTKWEQEVGGAKLKVEVQTVIHPEQRILADQWTFISSSPVEITGEIPIAAASFEVVPGGSTTEFRMRSKMAPSDMKVLSVFAASGGATAKGMPSSVEVKGKSVIFQGAGDGGRPTSFQRIHSFGKSPNWISMMAARGVAYRMRVGWDDPEPLPTFQALSAASAQIWHERWKTDIEIDGPVEDQRAVRSFLFYLRSAVHPESTMSVSPMGLSNQQYNGHVFWDADIWVFPALALISPETAIQIAKYRVFTEPTAERNFADWLWNGRPIATGKLGHVATTRSPRAAMFPWESSVSGKETVPGSSKFEHHITGSVAFISQKAAVLGLLGTEEAGEIVHQAGNFYRWRSDEMASKSAPLEIKGTMSPDENHVGDNDLYTNLLAEWCAYGGKFQSWRWIAHTGEISFEIKLPKDATSFLTYDNDPLKGYKQAAAVLAIYPLQYPPAEMQAKVMMDRFADKVTENGPAMSDSIHALIWARLGEKEKAYTTWHESWQPFTNHPLMLFSEKRKKAVTYFTTGAAGSLQTVLYGFLGIRIDSEQVPGAAWSKKLHGDSWLSIKPNLPPSWKSVKFKNFKLLGESYTLTATPTATKVVPGE